MMNMNALYIKHVQPIYLAIIFARENAAEYVGEELKNTTTVDITWAIAKNEANNNEW